MGTFSEERELIGDLQVIVLYKRRNMLFDSVVRYGANIFQKYHQTS